MIKPTEINAVSRAVIGAAFKKHPTSVNRWVERGCPINDDGRSYNLCHVIEWRLDELALSNGKPTDETANSKKYLAEYRKQRARNEKLKADSTEQKLIAIDDVKALTARIVFSARNRLLGLPSALAPIIADQINDRETLHRLSQRMDAELHDALSELAGLPLADADEGTDDAK